jgi:hypothetical protein
MTSAEMVTSGDVRDIISNKRFFYILLKDTRGWQGECDHMVALVTQMPDLNKRLQDARLDHDKTLLKRQVEATDAAIDKLVYELYGLTEEEIKNCRMSITPLKMNSTFFLSYFHSAWLVLIYQKR